MVWSRWASGELLLRVDWSCFRFCKVYGFRWELQFSATPGVIQLGVLDTGASLSLSFHVHRAHTN